MHGVERSRLGARCHARTRQHSLCQNASMPNGRCRMHGGKSLSGAAHGRFTFGFYTRQHIAARKAARAYTKQLFAELQELGAA